MVNKIILGTVQLGLNYGINNTNGKPSTDEAMAILNLAHDSGISILDTAEAYGNSQEIIGLFHKKHPDKKFEVITKLSQIENITNTTLKQLVENNIKTLQVANLYCYMFHHFDEFLEKKELIKELLVLKKEKKIQKIGISIYDNSELSYILENTTYFDIVQVPFNLLDNASIKKELLEKAKQKNIEIHVRSVFLQGLFFKPLDQLPEKLKVLEKEIIKLQNIQKENEIDMATLALKYTLEKKYIDYCLIGVDSVAQLKNNLKTIVKTTTIPHQEIDTIKVENTELLNPTNWN